MAIMLVLLGGMLALACAVGAWLLLDLGLIGAILVYFAVSIAAAMAIHVAGLVKHVVCRGTPTGKFAGPGPPLTATGNRGAAGGRTQSPPATPPVR